MNLSETLRIVSETDNEAHAALFASLLNTDAVARRALGLSTSFTAKDVQRLMAHFRDYVPTESGLPIPVRLPRTGEGSAGSIGPQAVADALKV
jgi:hypothetical protein